MTLRSTIATGRAHVTRLTLLAALLPGAVVLGACGAGANGADDVGQTSAEVKTVTPLFSEDAGTNGPLSCPAAPKTTATVVGVDMGPGETYFRMSDGTALASGYTVLTSSGTVVKEPGLTGLAQIASNAEATSRTTSNVYGCALATKGTIKCWGGNEFGELGNGTTTGSDTPVNVSGITDATQLQAGGDGSVCAVLASGAIDCWGYNGDGELGNGTTTNSSVPVPVKSADSFTKVVFGGYGTVFGLTDNGTVDVWGSNNCGQFGKGTADSLSHPLPQAVPGLGAITDIAAGLCHACALRADGTVHCWGQNADGEVGDGAFSSADSPPVQVALSGVTQIAVAGASTCAKNATGVYCWGDDYYGELGDGTATDSASPKLVASLGPVAAISSWNNLDGFCALMESKAVDCWGSNELSQFGDCTRKTAFVPTLVPLP